VGVIKGLDRAKARYKARATRTRTEIQRVLKQAGKEGASYAKRIAPQDTGTLANSVTFTANGMNEAFIYVQRVGNPKGGVTTQYGKIMHDAPLGVARRVWRSGDPHFMVTTRNFVRKRFGVLTKTAIGKILGKK
jgi:hypothetical protein